MFYFIIGKVVLAVFIDFFALKNVLHLDKCNNNNNHNGVLPDICVGAL